MGAVVEFLIVSVICVGVIASVGLLFLDVVTDGRFADWLFRGRL
jgi:hypothetical protein